MRIWSRFTPVQLYKKAFILDRRNLNLGYCIDIKYLEFKLKLNAFITDELLLVQLSLTKKEGRTLREKY